MYLYGASGHAKVIIDVLHSQGIEIKGLVDDNPNLSEMMGVKVYHKGIDMSPMIVSIGDNFTRMKIVHRLSSDFGVAVSKFSIVSPYAMIGKGSVVMQNAVIQSCTNIGEHCIINTSTSVDHECEIGNFVHIAPNVALCGNVKVGEGTLIGVGSCVKPGIKIGKWCIIGAGSVVVKDIPDFSVAYGNECKVIKINEMKEKITQYTNLLVVGGETSDK